MFFENLICSRGPKCLPWGASNVTINISISLYTTWTCCYQENKYHFRNLQTVSEKSNYSNFQAFASMFDRHVIMYTTIELMEMFVFVSRRLNRSTVHLRLVQICVLLKNEGVDIGNRIKVFIYESDFFSTLSIPPRCNWIKRIDGRKKIYNCPKFLK